MIGFVVILPLFISMGFLFISLVYGLNLHVQSYSLCYQTGAKIQMQLKEKLIRLLSMNPKAKNLRLRRKRAEILLKKSLLTGNPTAVSFAVKKLMWIKNLQKIFSIRQRRIILQSQMIVKKEWQKFVIQSKKLKNHFQKKENKTPLAVVKKPKNSLSPDYIPMKNFSENQKIKIRWTMNIFQNLPSFIKELFYFNKVSRHHCTVSLERFFSRFQVRLMK